MTASTTHFTSPKWLKIVSIIGVVWYAFGLFQFYMGITTDTASAIASGAMTAAHAAALESTPTIIWAAFALASALGLLGAVALFKQSSIAKILFLGSLVFGAIYFGWIYLFSGTGSDRPSEEMGIAVVVLGVTIAFNWLARRYT